MPCTFLLLNTVLKTCMSKVYFTLWVSIILSLTIEFPVAPNWGGGGGEGGGRT